MAWASHLLLPPSISASKSLQLASLQSLLRPSPSSRQWPIVPLISSRLASIASSSNHAASTNQNQVHQTSSGQPIGKLYESMASRSTIATVAVAAPPRPGFINDLNRLPPLEQALLLLGFILCMIVGTFVALFAVAVPTLLAAMRLLMSASKLHKLARKELPGTIAAIKLSGIEINSLTRDLNYLKRKLKGRPFKGNTKSGDSDTGKGKNSRIMN